MNKVILIVSDALRDDTAKNQMGYLQSLVESKIASRYTVIAELPTVSRPLYETIQTGVPPLEHGITSNGVMRRSTAVSVFNVASQAGLTTAAAAYSWYSELYNHAPYNPITDKEVDDEGKLIQHGRFYAEDTYPDAELFTDAAALVHRFEPDYLVVHPMGMDYIGESYGSESDEYQNHAIVQDQILGTLLPSWLEKGYVVLVTADHGMSPTASHGGTTPDVRHVPLYLINPHQAGRGDTGETISQLQLAPTVCQLLGLEIPESMKGSIVE